MEKNNIFNLNRFLALIGTGIYRRKNSKSITFAIATGITILFVILEKLVSNLDFDNARTVLTRVYQISYIIFLSIPAYRMAFNEQMHIQWNLLPASAFEKNLFSILGMLIWRSILFFIAIYGLDYILWSSTPFIEEMGMDISQCRIRLTEFFTLGTEGLSLPRWVSYILVFFFYSSLPIMTGMSNNNSLNQENTFSYVYLVYIIFSTFLHYCFSDDSRVYMMILLASFGIVMFLYIIIFSIVRSCNTKA